MVLLDVDVQSMELISKKCKICGNKRRFLKGTPRDTQSICGNCWDWDKEPSYVKLTPEQKKKLEKLLSES